MGAEGDKEVVLKGLRAWNEDDWATMKALTAPDCVISAPEGWPESGTFQGWDAIRRQYERLKESLSDERVEVLAVEATGNHRVLVKTRWRGHWDSGLELDLENWTVYEIAEGKIAGTHFHFDEAPARAAMAAE